MCRALLPTFHISLIAGIIVWICDKHIAQHLGPTNYSGIRTTPLMPFLTVAFKREAVSFVSSTYDSKNDKLPPPSLEPMIAVSVSQLQSTEAFDHLGFGKNSCFWKQLLSVFDFWKTAVNSCFLFFKQKS